MFFKLFILVLELNYFSESLEIFQQPITCDSLNSKPEIRFPTNIIQLHNENLQEYVVTRKLESNESFVITCTSSQPVDWRFNGMLGNTVVKSERSVTNFRLFPNGTSPGLCYHNALIFNSIENEITGQYICLVKPELSLDPWNKKGFGKSGVTFTLFSGLSLLTLTKKELTYKISRRRILRNDRTYHDYFYDLPCSRNHPEANISVYYKNDEESQWMPSINFYETRGVSVTIKLTKNDLPRIYKCEATSESRNITEIVITNILRYPVALTRPSVHHRDSVYMHSTTFYCISRVPIRIFKTDDLRTELKSTTERVDFVPHYINKGFTGTQAVQIDISSYNGTLRKSVSDLRGKIVCQDIETNGTIVSYSWNYEIRTDIDKLTESKRNNLNRKNKTAECLTNILNQQEPRIEYIMANNQAELSLQQNCLHKRNRDWNLCKKSNNSWPVQRYNGITDPSIVSANLPGKLSGAFSCDGPNLYNQNGNFYDVFSPTVYGELGNVHTPIQYYIKLTPFPQHIINHGDPVDVLCESNQMYFYGHAHWVILWLNNTYSSVPETWIQEDNTTKKNAFYARKSKIIIDSMEVKEITCGAIPIDWNSTTATSSPGVNNLLVYPHSSYTFHVHNAKTILKLSDIKQLKLSDLMVAAACTILIFTFIGAIFGHFWSKLKSFKRDVAFKLLLQKFFDGCKADGSDKNDIFEVAENQPYDISYEIKMEDLKIEWGIPLGFGAFGIVLKGTVSNASSCKKLIVAVKTVKGEISTANTEVLNGLMCELKVMIYIGQHPNIVCLMGAVTKKLAKKEMYVLLEYCENGCLYNYLKKRRSSFMNSLNTNVSNSQFCYASMHLLNWSRQIVSGMEYLAQKKVIHGDLATRNILLDNALNAKISDFGLSRRLYEKYEYVKTSNDPIPWRWLAVESLRTMTFSAESDVWAFGVTLWEIFSLALTPYACHRYSNDFISLLENGHRLPKPEHMSEELYKVMTQCWEVDPKNRLEFSDLSKFFDRMAKQIEVSDKGARVNESIYIEIEE